MEGGLFQNRWIFRDVSRGGGGHFLIKNLSFFELRIYLTTKRCQNTAEIGKIFSCKLGWGSKAVWNFCENSYVCNTQPSLSFESFCIAHLFQKLVSWYWELRILNIIWVFLQGFKVYEDLYEELVLRLKENPCIPKQPDLPNPCQVPMPAWRQFEVRSLCLPT